MKQKQLWRKKQRHHAAKAQAFARIAVLGVSLFARQRCAAGASV